MMKVLTVLVPAFNMEKYLQKCLESLILNDKEAFSTLEVLVINDGSSDNTSNIAHKYEQKFPDVFKVIDKENGGKGSCINAGLKSATGKYIKELDADDWFDNVEFCRFLKAIAYIDVDVIFNDVVVVGEKGNVRAKWQYNFSEGLTDFYDIEEYFEKQIVQMHAITYKCQLLLDINFEQSEGISYTDQEWTFLPFQKVKSVYRYKAYLYYYLLGRTGQSLDPAVSSKKIGDTIHCYINLLKAYSSLNNLDNRNYLDYRLKYNFKLLYQRVLVKGRTSNIKLANEVDNEIKKISLSFYNELALIRFTPIFPFLFIKKWRSSKSKLLPAYYKYFLLLSRIIVKVASITGVSIKCL